MVMSRPQSREQRPQSRESRPTSMRRPASRAFTPVESLVHKRGPLSVDRRPAAAKVFDAMDVDMSGGVDVGEFRSGFAPRHASQDAGALGGAPRLGLRSYEETFGPIGGKHQRGPTSDNLVVPSRPAAALARISSDSALLGGSLGGSRQASNAGRRIFPQEELTDMVLDRIYPRVSLAPFEDDPAADAEGAKSKTPSPKKRPNRRESFAARRATLKGGEPSPPAHSGGEGSPAAGDRKYRSQDELAQAKLMQFRKTLIDKFSTLQSAFNLFCQETHLGMSSELSRKELSRFLDKHFDGLTMEENDLIFDFLDDDKNGFVSMQEFHAAIEATSPIEKVEDFRRRFIAMGFTTTRQALTAMGERPDRQLTLDQFTRALSRVGVTHEEEAKALFSALCDPNEPGSTTSLGELTAALAATGPSLLLEDIRDRLIHHYGDLAKAFNSLNHEVDMDSKLFCVHAMTKFHMTRHEAVKAFRLIDIDGNGKISCNEFVGALKLSEPALFLEELRRKVRQRFHSIQLVLEESARKAQDQQLDNRAKPGTPLMLQGARPLPKTNLDLGRPPQVPKDYQNVLASLEITEAETDLLFQLVDINGDGRLSPREFERGIRLFAPACMLETLRMQCLKVAKDVDTCFGRLPKEKRAGVLDVAGLEKVLARLGLSEGVSATTVFDLVETRREGGLSVRELTAALRAATAGRTVPLAAAARDSKARQAVRWQMAPFRRTAGDLRSFVRAEPPDTRDYSGDAPPLGSSKDSWAAYSCTSEQHLRRQRRLEKSAPPTRSSISAFSPIVMIRDDRLRQHVMERATAKPVSPTGGLPPRESLRNYEEEVPYKPAEESFERIRSHLSRLPPAEVKPLNDSIHFYYRSVGTRADGDSKILKGSMRVFPAWKRNEDAMKGLA